jgi:4-amino-4-deoxy-L-arabinose transferase-like glycosyltransferase
MAPAPFEDEALMTFQSMIEILLAAAALLLLSRDLRRAWRDPPRRPVTLLVAALVAILLLGTLGGRSHPSPWWLIVPAAVLVWEVVRGWRQARRSHLWEAGVGAFAAGLLLAVVALGVEAGTVATALLALFAGVLGAGLLWRSNRREPHPWRDDDPSHYERRLSRRP